MNNQNLKDVIKDRYGKIARGEQTFCCPSCGPTTTDQCLAVGYTAADLRLDARGSVWEGADNGSGRLDSRRLTIAAEGASLDERLHVVRTMAELLDESGLAD